MKKLKNIVLLGLFSLAVISCEVEDGQNLNGPTTDTASGDLSRAELIQTMAGALADMRGRLGTQIDANAVAGREYWRFQSSDPRWTADLLSGILDNNTFYTTGPFAARYSTVKDINIILGGLENSSADFSDAEKAATRGFANTIKAHELLMVLNQQFQNGIRLDVNDPNNLGPFVSYDVALTAIFDMLASAATDLSNGGGAFPFTVPSGFDGLKADAAGAITPADFATFTNGLAARVEAYRGNYASVNTLLGNSFMDMAGDLTTGAYFTFSLTGADVSNPLFFAKNSTVANARIAHPSFITDAEAGDTRLGKVVLRELENDDTGMIEPNPLTSDGLTGTHDVFIYDGLETSVGIMRNEELILLSAEANHITDPAAAVAAIDVIRTAAGLPAYSGGTAPADLVTEILNQRRYSLYAEGGHRWIDLRRFDRISDLEPLDRAGDGTFVQFPIPANENQ